MIRPAGPPPAYGPAHSPGPADRPMSRAVLDDFVADAERRLIRRRQERGAAMAEQLLPSPETLLAEIDAGIAAAAPVR